MKFTKEEYIKLTDRFNALSFNDQLQKVIDNPEILEAKIIFSFKGIPDEIAEELNKENKILIPYPIK
jgi:hypothetical protein